MKKSLYIHIALLVGCFNLHADMTEMVLYPSSDFSSAVAHFYHQGDKSEKYGFVFDEGFDPKNIVYAQPDSHTIKTQSDKKVQLIFDKTDRYSYMQQLAKKDFVVGEEGNKVKILVSSGDCVSGAQCTTKRTFLSAVVPSGYKVLEYKGLDHDLAMLKEREWKIKENVYTLIASNVKGASLYMELEKISTPPPSSKTPKNLVYENTQLFEKGDVILSTHGLKHLKTMIKSIGTNDKLLVGIFQDRVPPKRLSYKYPTSEKFSKARAETLYAALQKCGLRADQVRIEIVDRENERTRVEMVITPAQ